jgi:hypothetical protein
MHRSSESIAALAAALAKAQSELSNPEKSLVATIGADRPGERARAFRYAPLSNGLDLVRKALGQQQIATVQTTAIGSAAEAAQWARTALPAKNTLTASDARMVEVAFELRLSSLVAEGALFSREQCQRRPRNRTHPLDRRVQDRPSQGPAALAGVPRRAKPSRPASTRACCRSGSHAGIGTGRTSNSSPRSPA